MSFINFSRKEVAMQSVNPFKIINLSRLILALALFALILQLIIISYNQFTGYIDVKNGLEYIVRLVYGTALSLIAANLLMWPNLKVIYWLNRYFNWSSQVLKRIVIEFAATILVGVLIAVFITVLAHAIDNYEQPFGNVLFNNALIVAVVNMLFMISLEAWLFFTMGKNEEKRAADLSKELELAKFEVLKDQLKPHFMFNSLNVLSGLIDENTDKAQEFIGEFASVYRYVLDTIERNLISVREELDFAASYMFLQQVRYGKMLHYTVQVSDEFFAYFIPPLTLQVVLENAIKHNEIQEGSLLNVRIYSADDNLVIENNLNPKAWSAHSSGIGQQNLKKRFAMLGAPEPIFLMKAKSYTVYIPCIKTSEK
ncbi:sensor histidine kinase [Salinivirga cyanobacteriivorans]